MAMAGAMLGAVGSVVGGIGQSNAYKQEAEDQRNIAAWNAARQREKAALAQSKGAANARIEREKGEQAVGKYRATVAQSGGSTTQSAPLLMQQVYAQEISYNSKVAMFNAKTEQADRNNEAKKQLYEGEMRARAAEAKADAALLQGFTGAVSSLGGAFG